MKFTVDRSKWRCGFGSINRKGNGFTKLLNEAGYMCCLGFCSKQLGYDNLLNLNTPSSVGKVKYFTETLDDGNVVDSDLSRKAMAINDSSSFVEEKEKQLKELFKEYGHEIEFIGEYDAS